jgi:hypothetical protein
VDSPFPPLPGRFLPSRFRLALPYPYLLALERGKTSKPRNRAPSPNSSSMRSN